MRPETELLREITRKWQSACENYDATWNSAPLALSNRETARREALASLVNVKTELDQLIDSGNGLKDPFVVGIINPVQSR